MKNILLSTLFFQLSSNCLACLPANGEEFEISGEIVPALYKTEDSLAHYRALKFDKAECFAPDGEFSDNEVSLSQVQLIIPEELKIEIGKKYTVRGTAFHWHTGHHFTGVVLSVKNAEKL